MTIITLYSLNKIKEIDYIVNDANKKVAHYQEVNLLLHERNNVTTFIRSK